MVAVKKPAHTRAKTFLKEWREFRSLTQEEAAERLEIDRTTLSKIERREVPYNQDFLERAALAYGCDASDLLSINPTAPDPPRLIYDRLKNAKKEHQERALAIINALLDVG